ncbi:MAG: ATP phosphoribosyltransferase [Candidatus Magnetoglobus multicellularis str. Araruama]|uniref:ATP phosphoribosyltransferase n=1 Tax=Candidatus Magnetoglobus multicellularis str. Araruama TaxID=890399 RepID=A0A1V1PI36_9BACT|nr:MAG: ATP phosphoribosyltransferase [Candidatus Magnetoglobus multicellularis str. Araruama]
MAGILDKLNLALPDGHQMNHLVPFLEKSGISFPGYEKSQLERRPKLICKSDQALSLIPRPEKVTTKVIRPQDMPSHVANANFDLAVTGTDWCNEHRLRFPGSPVVERLKLGFAKVRIVAAAHKDMGNTLNQFIHNFREKNGNRPIRLASEYVYIADNYALLNQLYPYRVIMTYGATESLIPEDADLIIENTETGNTLKKTTWILWKRLWNQKDA